MSVVKKKSITEVGSVNINISYMIVERIGLGFSCSTGGELKWRIFLGLQFLCAIVKLIG